MTENYTVVKKSKIDKPTKINTLFTNNTNTSKLTRDGNTRKLILHPYPQEGCKHPYR